MAGAPLAFYTLKRKHKRHRLAKGIYNWGNSINLYKLNARFVIFIITEVFGPIQAESLAVRNLIFEHLFQPVRIKFMGGGGVLLE